MPKVVKSFNSQKGYGFIQPQDWRQGRVRTHFRQWSARASAVSMRDKQSSTRKSQIGERRRRET